jgi:Protein of unknown function (DUF2889)
MAPMLRAHPDPSLRPIWPQTSGPSSGAPARLPGSVRRTTSLDIGFDPADGFPLHVHLTALGRDLTTPGSGIDLEDAARAQQRAELRVEMMTGLTTEVTVPPGISADALTGIPAGGRFRKVIAGQFDRTRPGSNLLTQILDDVPIGMVISGSSVGRRGLIPVGLQGTKRVPTPDVCIGWRSGGEMQRAIDEGDTPYMGEGPIAGSLELAEDPFAWHAMDQLVPGSLRRRRRIDAAPFHNGLGLGYTIDAMFRDSYIEPDGTETAIHEYELRLTTDEHLRIVSSVATPRVLPGPECPGAAASVERLVGCRLDEIRDHVTAEFNGATVCTHLNDLCRSVGLFAILVASGWGAPDASR